MTNENPFKGSFMQPHIEHGDYFEVETSHGTEIVSADVVGGFRGTFAAGLLDVDAPEWPAMVAALRDYLDGEPTSCEAKTGWLARMSAPGYSDCTDWTAHETEEGAMAYLVEMYGNDDAGMPDTEDTSPRPVGALLALGDAYLQHERFALLQDSQDIAATCESIARDSADVTGMLVYVGDGDYIEVWSTGSSRPYVLTAVYECVMARKDGQ